MECFIQGRRAKVGGTTVGKAKDTGSYKKKNTAKVTRQGW